MILKLRIIDLSLPIRTHWRWKIKFGRTKEHEKKDDGQSSWIEMSAHSFTHVDAPLHKLPNGSPLSEVPLSKFYGETAVVDLTFKEANEEITSEDLEKKGKHIREGDIVLLKTNWQLKQSLESKEFWDCNPFLGMDGAKWLIKKGSKTIGFDFPLVTNPEHIEFFRAGIVLIEYLTNLDKIKQDRILLYALPLKIEYRFEGAPARVIAIID